MDDWTDANDLVYFYQVPGDDTWYQADENQTAFINSWKIRQTPRPLAKTGQRVYVPTRFWYEKDVIREVEPLFSNGGSFCRFVYWCRGPGGEMLGVDHFLTRKEALKSMLKQNVRVFLDFVADLFQRS